MLYYLYIIIKMRFKGKKERNTDLRYMELPPIFQILIFIIHNCNSSSRKNPVKNVKKVKGLFINASMLEKKSPDVSALTYNITEFPAKSYSPCPGRLCPASLSWSAPQGSRWLSFSRPDNQQRTADCLPQPFRWFPAAPLHH